MGLVSRLTDGHHPESSVGASSINKNECFYIQLLLLLLAYNTQCAAVERARVGRSDAVGAPTELKRDYVYAIAHNNHLYAVGQI